MIGMELLHSNYPPVRSGGRTFAEAFYDLLTGVDCLDIAVGYVTPDSLVELQKLVELNDIKTLNLTIGMHYLEKFTQAQYSAAKNLNQFLMSNHKGEVRLVTPFRYHGKLYSYSDANGAVAGIIGSANLGSIIEGGTRVYESALLVQDRDVARQMKDFIGNLVNAATKNINDLPIEEFITSNLLLDEHENVKRVKTEEMRAFLSTLTNTTFEIPIKTAEVSAHANLNAFFGRGRVSKNGLVKPRHWYEVELIVPKEIAMKPGYPRSKTSEAEFTVITDDMWSFRCKVSGDANKNFRSEGDLKVLGKWLKGRLENAGALMVGEPVTNETLREYGRNSFTFTKSELPNTWYLNFERH